MGDRVEVDVADLEALRDSLAQDGYTLDRNGYDAAERLVAAIPKPRLVPTERAVRLYAERRFVGSNGSLARMAAKQDLLVAAELGMLAPEWTTAEETDTFDRTSDGLGDPPPPWTAPSEGEGG